MAADGGEPEPPVLGSGEPVALVPTAQNADGLLPLAEHLRGDFTAVHFSRRGYAGSSPATPPGDVAREAADCARLLVALGLEWANAVGVFFSAAVALQLAADRPDLVHTLTLVEPPPVHGAGDTAFRLACADLPHDRRAGAQRRPSPASWRGRWGRTGGACWTVPSRAARPTCSVTAAPSSTSTSRPCSGGP